MLGYALVLSSEASFVPRDAPGVASGGQRGRPRAPKPGVLSVMPLGGRCQPYSRRVNVRTGRSGPTPSPFHVLCLPSCFPRRGHGLHVLMSPAHGARQTQRLGGSKSYTRIRIDLQYPLDKRESGWWQSPPAL